MLQDAIGLFWGSESSNYRASQDKRGLKIGSSLSKWEISLSEIVQSLLENHPWWGLYCVPGEIVLVKRSFSLQKHLVLTCFPRQLTPVAPCSLCVASCEKKTSVLFELLYSSSGSGDTEGPLNLLFLRETWLPSVFSCRLSCPVLWSTSWHSFRPSLVYLHLSYFCCFLRSTPRNLMFQKGQELLL